jgi:hypothetical protein
MFMTSMKNIELQKTVAAFALHMGVRLAEKEAEGYTGWDGKDEHPTFYELLSAIQQDLVEIGYTGGVEPDSQKLYLDIANRCMMLWYRNKQEHDGTTHTGNI